MNRKTTVAGLAVLSIGALVLAGCASSTPEGGSGSPGGAEPDELPLIGYPEGDAVVGGTLNLAIASSPTAEGSWNSNHADSSNVDVMRMLDPTLGSLVRIKDDGDWELNPDWASSIELTSESPQVVTVTLNEDAVFEDGTSITAADYQATLNALRNVDANGEKIDPDESPTYEVIPSAAVSTVSDVDVVGDYEFTVTFSEPFADWASTLSLSVLPASIAGDVDAFNTGYNAQPVPSVGPYKFDQIDNAASIYTLVPNPEWWGEEPKLDSITFRALAQEALPQAFANDEIDYFSIQTPDAIATAETKAGAVIQRSGGRTWAHLTFNGNAAPFDDVNVRRAVASAINRENISAVVNAPLGVDPIVKNDWIYMPGQNGYVDAFSDTYSLDLEAAAGYLEDAGYAQAEDGGPWTKDGTELTFAIIVPVGTQSNISRAEGVIDALAPLGVTVTLDQSPPENYFTNIQNGDYQAATFSWQGTAFPASSAMSVYYPAQEYGSLAGQNYSFVTDERLATMWPEANADLDPESRIEKMNAISAVLAEYLPSIPIYPLSDIAASSAGLVNYGVATFKSTDWTKVGFTE